MILFLLFIGVIIFGIVIKILDNILYNKTRWWNFEDWLQIFGNIIIGVGIAAVIISSIIIVEENHLDGPAQKAMYEQRYESLTYQLENDLYDNDNDLGKKELYNEIRIWNEEIAYCKAKQHNIWTGLFYANIYDDIKFIEYK